MKKILILLSIVILSSCKKENFDVINLNGNKITALGHGGMGINSLYPINSFESIQKSIALGMDGSEIDIQMTKDGVLVLFHDERLEHSTTASGIVNDLYWEELNDVKYVRTPYQEYKILRLDDAFKYLPKDIIIALDCKFFTSNPSSDYYKKFTFELNKLISEYNLKDRIIIETFNTIFITEIQSLNTEITIFSDSKNYDENINRIIEYNLNGMIIPNDNITKEQIKNAHQLGFQVTLWNVKSKSSNREAILKNPDYIQTDNVRALNKLLN